MRTVGIVGVGVVGSAMLQTFTEAGLKVIAYDKFRPGFNDEDIHFEALVDAEFVFVSVPTLTREDGSQDTKPLEEVLKRLSGIRYNGIVVSKCTTLPGFTRSLAMKYTSLKIVHYPEFLTAAKAYEDFKFQPAAILSGYQEHTLEVAEFLRDIFPRLTIRLYSKFASTEFAKYVHNCFLATKVAFMNEIYDACEEWQVNYEEMIQGALLMGKIGENHLKVPGPDGQRGFGGFCFPKDTKAFVTFISGANIHLDVLKGAITANEKVKKKRHNGYRG